MRNSVSSSCLGILFNVLFEHSRGGRGMPAIPHGFMLLESLHMLPRLGRNGGQRRDVSTFDDMHGSAEWIEGSASSSVVKMCLSY